MSVPKLPAALGGVRVYLVGIKGTGMCALAELLLKQGARVSGSDTTDTFYTDTILRELGIPFTEGFSASSLPADTEYVIHSAAYSCETNPELALALERGLPLLKYTEALGAFSERSDSSGIAGVHGKTTTTALSGVLARGSGLDASILAGSAVGGFGGRSTLSLGSRFFIAETCEYRRHFLSFSPRRIILTSVESDHQDYYPTYADIRSAFIEYAEKLPPDGELIYCADDPGACEVAASIRKSRADIRLIPYGLTASGPFRIEKLEQKSERTLLKLAAFDREFTLRVPGRHVAIDAAAALALTDSLVRTQFGKDGWTPERLSSVAKELEDFRGSRRRSEILGEADGVLVMDDYGHHPTAIRTTLEGLRDFYPDRRLVVSFMSHTYTRTAALLDEFAASFGAADILVLHKIYASAREHYEGGVNGFTLYEKAKALWKDVRYVEEPLDAVESLLKELRPGDLFLSMGAGDNFKLSEALLSRLESRTAK